MNSNSAFRYFTPYLLAFLFPLHYYNHNTIYLEPTDLWRLIAWITLTVTLLWAVLLVIFRALDLTLKVLFYFIFLWALYPVLYLLVSTCNRVTGLPDRSIPLSLALYFLLLACMCLHRNRLPYSYFLQRYAGIFVAIFVVFNMPTINQIIPTKTDWMPQGMQSLPVGAEVDRLALPHIIYIVPDRYPNDRSLEKYYAFSNQSFIKELRKRGFFVWDDSYASYPKTFLSLASVLNAQYLDFLTEQFGREEARHHPVYSLLRDNEMQRVLKEIGYYYVHMANWWQPTKLNSNADEVLSGQSELTEFEETFISSLPVGHVISLFKELRGRTRSMELCEIIHKQFDKAFEAVRRPEPQFVFWHLYLPHPPFIFDETGRCLPQLYMGGGSWERRQEAFLKQLRFTNTYLVHLIDTIREVESRPTIIAVQADEGPFPWRYVTNEREFRWFEATDDELQLKFGILNAMYLPSQQYMGFAEDTAPINNLRRIFNDVFDAGLPMLESRHYTFNIEREPYDFKEISDRLIHRQPVIGEE